MTTLHNATSISASPKSSTSISMELSGGYQFWGVRLSNIPSSTTVKQIEEEFKKYGDIYRVVQSSTTEMKVVFCSPKQQNSITDIINEQTKFKVTALSNQQLPVGKKMDSSKTTKLSLMSNPPVSKSSKYNNHRNMDLMNAKLLAKNSKLNSDAPPFRSPPRVHTIPSLSKKKVSSSSSSTSSASHSNHSHDENEGVFFEAVCKSITHGTTEEDVLDFIAKEIFSSIKAEVVKDGMMMLPGESMAVFELSNKDAINKLTQMLEKKIDCNLQFKGHKFTLQRKTGNDDVPPPNVKGLSIKFDEEDELNSDRTINSNGVNVVNEKNGIDYLVGIGFEDGITIEAPKQDDDSKEDSNAARNYYFKLPENARKCVAKQAESLGVPKASMVLMLGVYTQSGPVPTSHFRRWKQQNPAVTNNLFGTKSSSTAKKGDIVPNLDSLTDSSDKNSAALSNKSGGNATDKSSPIVGSIGSTPAAAALFGDGSGSKKSSPVSGDKKQATKKLMPSNSTGSTPMTKAPLIANKSDSNVQSRLFQYPNSSGVGASSLFANSSSGNLLNLISPRGNVNLIQMKSTGSTNLVSPTAAALISPRRPNTNNGGPAPVLVPGNANDFTNANNGFSMGTPMANLTPVHIPPYLANNANAAANNGHSPIATGFHSPLNYNINTPQSPLGNYPGITPIINAFTPTAQSLNAITPTANVPFFWNLQQQNNNKLNNAQATAPNTINEDNNNMDTNTSSFNNPAQSTNPYVQSQLQNNPLLSFTTNSNTNKASSPLSKEPSTFFKYPIPAEEPKQSPRNSNNMLTGNMVNSMLNGLNNSIVPLQQQHSANSFTSGMSANFANNSNNNLQNMANMASMNSHLSSFNNNEQSNAMLMNNYGSNNSNNHMVDDDGDNEDERQMEEPPSLDEINNMRSIPSVISPNGTTPVVMITNLNEDEIDCDKIFTLCGVFGDVQRVKISYHKRDTAFVQLSNHRQAKHVVQSLNRMQLYGKMIHVNLSRMTRVKLPKDSPNSAMMFPDAKFLTKDYTNCKKHRYSKKGAGGIKYSPLSIGQPSHILHIANLPIQSEAKDLQEFLCGAGIFAQQNQSNNSLNAAGSPAQANHRLAANAITSIELIGVNNKLGSCQAFAKCCSVDIACQILIDYHSKEFLGREIKISFATRSHMPSDINKTHKNYAFSIAPKSMGASINSIPKAIPRQNSDANDSNLVAAANGDNMSSSSSAASSHTNNDQDDGNNHNPMNSMNNAMNNSMNNGYNSHETYSSRSHGYVDYARGQNQVFPPKNMMNPRHYIPNYDNSVGYQTYVVNNKPPPQDQDKIFVRQHHHSGGRKFHYKLRINK